MRLIRTVPALLLLATIAIGCGPQLLKTKGRVVKNGEPFIPAEGEVFRLTFIPILKDGLPKDLYAAEFNSENGTFQVAGKDLKGMPPGKYRVAIEYRSKRNPLKGNYGEEKSPYVYDVDSTTKEIVIDLEKPPVP